VSDREKEKKKRIYMEECIKRRCMRKPEISNTWWLTDIQFDPIGS
jgi:hypothetical protein